MINKPKLLLLTIVLLALSLRIYRINDLPALNADEAAIGYNAYSLLLTDRDEHSHPFPLDFQSFNDYKPGVYFYLAMPFIKLFSLSVMAVRLPNIIISTSSIILIYIFTNQIFPSAQVLPDKNTRKPEHLTAEDNWAGSNHEAITLPVVGRQLVGNRSGISPGHIAAFLLAISPWHLHYSRGAWETSVATAFVLAGSVLYLARHRLPRAISLLVPLPFIISLYTYHSARVFAPLLALFLLLKDKPDRKSFLSWTPIAFISLLPLLFGLFNQQSSSRFRGVGIIADRGPLSRAEELRTHHSPPSGIDRLTHNRYVEYSLRVIDNYTRHFNPNFLFLSGDEIERNRVPESGQLYLFEVVTLLLGVNFALRVRRNNPHLAYIFFWLAISPLASSLTFQSPNALRAQNMIIPLTILSAIGAYQALLKFPKIVVAVGSIVSLWSIAFYFHQYYSHLDYILPYSSQYGFKEMIRYVSETLPNYDKIYITTKYDQPYILTLFYLQYDPSRFQSDHEFTSRDRFGFSTVSRFAKFRFQPIVWEEVINEKRSLIVATPDEVPALANTIKTISFPNGTTAYKIIAN